MASVFKRRANLPTWLIWLLRAVLLVALFICFAPDIWRPWVDNYRCKKIASQLSEQYGLVVRYGDPSEFFVPPTPPIVNDPEIGLFIGPANRRSVFIALQGVQVALNKYPQKVVQKYLDAVFISGVIKIRNVQAAGTLLDSWIYVSAFPERDYSGTRGYELTLHHELSSVFINEADFPKHKWVDVNDPAFNYLSKKIDVIRAAMLENRQPLENATSWYSGGFVSDYGMSSMHNDFNTYAELAMADPAKLKQLAEQYPKIRAKTKILVAFYTHLAPELGGYFEKAGLQFDAPAVEHKTVSR